MHFSGILETFMLILVRSSNIIKYINGDTRRLTRDFFIVNYSYTKFIFFFIFPSLIVKVKFNDYLL